MRLTNTFSYNHNEPGHAGGYVMRGSIRCARRGCAKKRKGLICPHCGNSTVYIELYYRGKTHIFRRDKYNRVFTDYRLASDFLSEMRLQINDPNANFKPEDFKDSLPKRLSIKTRRNILNALHAMFKRMHRKGIIKNMPAWPVIEGNDSKERTALDYETQMEALNRIPEPHRSCIAFGFETGLRPGELCALKVKDIDEVNRAALIRRTWTGSKLMERTKGKNQRWIPLSSRAWEIIAPRLREALPEAFIFINPSTGTGYRQKALNNIWRKYSGLDVDRYSAGRHSFCTQLVHDGIGQFEAQALMRHADARTTQKYFHADTQKLSKWVERRGRGNVLDLIRPERT